MCDKSNLWLWNNDLKLKLPLLLPVTIESSPFTATTPFAVPRLLHNTLWPLSVLCFVLGSVLINLYFGWLTGRVPYNEMCVFVYVNDMGWLYLQQQQYVLVEAQMDVLVFPPLTLCGLWGQTSSRVQNPEAISLSVLHIPFRQHFQVYLFIYLPGLDSKC